MKKLISLFLALIMIMSCVPLTVLADEYYPACNYTGASIVDGLKSIGVSTSFDFRCKIAEANGFGRGDYEGSAEQNTFLLNRLKQGKLVIPSAQGSQTVRVSPISNPTSSILVGSHACTETMVEAVKDTTMRINASKDADILCNVQEGDCFKVVRSVINKWNNLWYEVAWAGTTGYIYSGNVTDHTHYYNKVDDRLSVCKCGTISVCSNTENIDYSVALSLNIEAIEAAVAVLFGTLETASTAVLGGLGVAFPVVALITVSGLVICFEVSASGAQIEDVAILETKTDVENRINKDGDNLYYKACTTANGGAIVIYKDGMDLKTAHKFIKYTATNPVNIAISDLTDTAICSVWTYDANNATKLAEQWCKNGRDYGYGKSTDYNRMSEVNKDKNGNPLIGYFEHYHLWFRPYNLFFLKKVDNAHIFWGMPMEATVA